VTQEGKMVSDLLIRLRALLQRTAVESELDDELRFHFDEQVEKFVQSGFSHSEARRHARLVFGGSDQIKEECREARGIHFLETSAQDIRYGIRMLYRNPAFTIVAVLTLALGIGVNVVAFTAYKAFFDRGLDARDPGKLVNVALVLHSGDTGAFFSYPDYEAYRDRLHSFSGLIATSGDTSLALSGAGGSVSQRSSADGSLAGELGLLPSSSSNKEFAATRMVSENYFAVLGIAPMRGRTFGDVSELAASPEVLISENYWQRRFGGDTALLGQTIRLNGVAFTIVGVTPRDFAGTDFDVPDFWLPLSLEPLTHPDSHMLSDRENHCCRLFARLAPSVSMEQAQAEMHLLAGHLTALHDTHSDWGKPATALLWPGSPLPLPINRLAGELKYAVLLIMLAVGMVLVIACANVASLQLARAASRKNELSMRLSLGASRWRLVRQLLTESALLGMLSGVVALLFSWILMKALASVAAGAFPAQYGTLVFHVNPDFGIFAYVFAISLAAGILFGLSPALESSRTALSPALKANPGTSPARSRRLHSVFIASQVAVALALMIAASMLIHSSIHAFKVDRGYDKQVVDLTLKFPEGSKYTADRKLAFVRELRTRLASMSRVVSITNANAPVYGYRQAAVSLNGEIPSDRNKRAFIDYTYVQADYFQTLGIPLLFGRNFQSQAGEAEPSVILSESAAKQLWPGENPIGRSLRLGTDGQFHRKNDPLPDGQIYQVIGIAGDTRGATFDGSDSYLVYLRLPEDRVQDYAILVRTSDPKQFMPAIRPLISSIDPDMEEDSETFEEMLRVSATFFLPSFAAAIASPVGLIGLLLASMGIYGTVSYIVVLRTREVGIRMALGAQKLTILLLMLQQCMRPVLAGLLAGMFLAMGASYLLRGALHGLSTVDGISFTGVSFFFAAMALLAAYLPSRRAMGVDPMVALRYE
jgi:predicted permease